jgi:hypothetical protein
MDGTKAVARLNFSGGSDGFSLASDGHGDTLISSG